MSASRHIAQFMGECYISTWLIAVSINAARLVIERFPWIRSLMMAIPSPSTSRRAVGLTRKRLTGENKCVQLLANLPLSYRLRSAMLSVCSRSKASQFAELWV